MEATQKKGGKAVTTARFVVSKDGKVLTITAKGADPKGPPVSNTIVSDKQ
jgi:hypothetical protein